MKRSILITTLTILMFIGAYEVEAQWGWGRGARGMGPGYCFNFGGLNLSQDQIESLASLRQGFWKDTTSLMAQLEQKQLELDTLMLEAAPDAKEATSLQKTISELQSQLAAKRLSHQLEAQKILTPEQQAQLPPGCNFGFGNMAGGFGPGYGCYMGSGFGAGRGPGWGRGCWW